MRNIGIFAHVDADKTTLSEQLLLKAGAIRSAGSGDSGTAHTDTLNVERRRGISVRSSCVRLFGGSLANRASVTLPGQVDPLTGEPGAVQCKITQIRGVDGADAGSLSAGEIGVVYGLGALRVGQVLGDGALLPQREGGCVADLPEEIEGMPKRKYLFRLDCAHMDRCDAVLFLFDGRVPDEGACFELGYCYAKGKRCVAYKTDARSFIDGYDNVMLHGAPEVVLRNEDELRAYLSQMR